MAYWYVNIANAMKYHDIEWYDHDTETAKLIDSKNLIKKENIDDKEYIELTSVRKGSSSLENFPIICEDDGYDLIDLVTGKKISCREKIISYKEVGELDTKYYHETLYFIKAVQLSDLEVVEKLRSLRKGDIRRYSKRLNTLEKAIKEGYQRELKRVHQEKYAKEELEELKRKLAKRHRGNK